MFIKQNSIIHITFIGRDWVMIILFSMTSGVTNPNIMRIPNLWYIKKLCYIKYNLPDIIIVIIYSIIVGTQR